MRSVPEWVGKSDNAAVPSRVRVRIFERHGGLCHISGRKIQTGDKWELDHIIPLCGGGPHAERNLAPVLKAPHKEKTKLDVATKSKTARMKAKHLGIKKRGRTIAYRLFDKTPVPSKWRD